MADTAAPSDALSLFTAALQAQDAATEQRKLQQLLDIFQQQPGNIPPLFATLVPMLHGSSQTFKKWIVDVIDLTFCKPTLGPQARNNLAYHMPEPILALLNDVDPKYAQVAIMAFASIYQPLFRLVCTDRTQIRLWPTIEAIKQRIVQMFELPQHMGIKLAAVKAFQKIILVQTRASDARGQPISKSVADANIGQIPADHAVLHASPLEQEGNERLKQIVYVIFTSSSADLVMASMNCLASLAKMRPSLSPIVFEALISWTPSALVSSPYMTVRSVEKTLRLLYQHFHPSRNSLAGPYASQIIEAVDNQKLRMETAARKEEMRKETEATARKRAGTNERKETGTAGAGTGKRKRVRFAEMDEEEDGSVTPGNVGGEPSGSVPGMEGMSIPAVQMDPSQQQQGDAMRLAVSDPSDPNPMAAFDATSLPLPLVIELVMANLEAVSASDLDQSVAQARARVNGEPIPLTTASGTGPTPRHAHPGSPPPPTVKAEDATLNGDVDEDAGTAQDPLQLDMGEEETLSAAEKHLQESAAYDGQNETGLAAASFTLKPPGDLDADECKALVSASVDRICRIGLKEAGNLSASAEDTIETGLGTRVTNTQLWTVLVTRLATRAFGEYRDVVQSDGGTGQVSLRGQSDAVRQLMLDFVVTDFPHRHDFALQWMAEEFHCYLLLRKQGRLSAEDTSPYTVWLQRITAGVIEKMDSKDKTLHDFLNRVPLLTDSIISTVQALCLDKTKMAAGFTILRDLAIHRVPARSMTCSILLGLTRNEEKMVRGAAIITVRNWVRVNGQGNSPAGEALEHDVLEFAKAGLKRLTVRNAEGADANGAQPSKGDEAERLHVPSAATDESSKNGEDDVDGAPTELSALENPNAEVHLDSDIVRLVELPFALCVRVSTMLDEIFSAYPAMPTTVQKAVEKHITPLIQNLGPNNAKLLSLINQHPEESDSLALCVFSIMSEKQRSKKMVDIVKQMAEERANDIDPRFLIPILPDLEKAEIIKYLPRVVSILSSEKAEDRTMLKNVFTSVVQPPEQGFGSVSTNLPRVRQSELLSPVELMSLLHHAEPDIGRKTAADAIRICFGMTDIFRSEVIGAVLNQLIEEPVLPVLFMRTAIMAVRTYKSLSSYISTIFLSRLITKKVWQQPLLWEGFVICAKQTSPASFGALIQLPRDQLRDVVSRQPELRVGLREYLVKRAGGNKARLKSFLELLGDSGEEDARLPHASNTPGSGTSTPQHIPAGMDEAS